MGVIGGCCGKFKVFFDICESCNAVLVNYSDEIGFILFFFSLFSLHFFFFLTSKYVFFVGCN